MRTHERVSAVADWWLLRTTVVFLFLLPWQTRWIFGSVPLEGLGAGNAGQEIAFGILSIYAVEVLIIVLAFLAMFARGAEVRNVFRSLRGPFLAMLGTLVAGAFLTQWPVIAWHHIAHIVTAMLVFVVIAIQRERMNVFILAFCGGLVIPTIVGVVQVVTGYFPPSTLFGVAERMAERPGDSVVMIGGDRVLRAYGSFSHPNIFGGYVSVGILLLVGLWNAWRQGSQKKSVVALLCILTLGLALSMSKTAVFGTALGLAIGYSAYSLRGARGWKKWGSVGTVLVGLLLVAGTVLLPRLAGGALEANSVGERLVQWQSYPQVIGQQVPVHWIVGLGPGAYVFAWHASDMMRWEVQDWWLYQPIHNVPALVLAEVGLIGFFALLWLLYRVDQRNYVALPEPQALAALMAGSSLFVIALFDHYLWSFWSGLVLAALVLAFTWGSGQIEMERER